MPSACASACCANCSRHRTLFLCMAIAVKFLTPAVGAEITGVDLAGLTDGEFAQIAEIWHQRSALLFRGQRIGDADLIDFSRRFGELDPPPNQERGRLSPPGYPDIYVVSNVLDASGQPIGALGAGEAVWHTDMDGKSCSLRCFGSLMA